MPKLSKTTNYKLKTAKGFSLMEVMLSVFLLSVGMLAAISLISGGLKESIDSRNQLIASLLAQEGVELVRNIRDNNWATGDAAGTFAHFPAGAANCRIDRDYSYPADLLCNGIYALNMNGNNFYTHDTQAGSTPTIFKRMIRLATNSGSDKIVTSMVIWKGSTFPGNIALCTTGRGCSYTQSTLTRWSE